MYPGSSGYLTDNSAIFASIIALTSWTEGSSPKADSTDCFKISKALWSLTSGSNPDSIVLKILSAIIWWPASDGWTPAPDANIIRTYT